MAGWDVKTDFAQFVEEMRHVSDEIKREVAPLIPTAAQSMVSTLTRRYPIGPTTKKRVGGQLRAGTRIRVRPGNDPILPVEQVIGAPHASLWQDGSVPRFNYTRKNAARGRMPAAAPRFFERTAAETRAAMLHHAQAVLDRPRQIGSIGSPGRLL